MVQLRFRAVDRDLFDYVRNGRKRYELRAGTERFRDLQDGDPVTIKCGEETLDMRVKHVRRFVSLDEVFTTVRVDALMPGVDDAGEAIRRINGFPQYATKIKDHGAIVMELERV